MIADHPFLKPKLVLLLAHTWFSCMNERMFWFFGVIHEFLIMSVVKSKASSIFVNLFQKQLGKSKIANGPTLVTIPPLLFFSVFSSKNKIIFSNLCAQSLCVTTKINRNPPADCVELRSFYLKKLPLTWYSLIRLASLGVKIGFFMVWNHFLPLLHGLE